MVVFRGYPTNLHAVWDTAIIEPALEPDERSYALKLVQDITPDKLESWSKGDPVAWANEGYEIAANKVYGKLPHSGTLPESYEAEALPIVNAQLAAGWRSVGNGTEQLSALILFLTTTYERDHFGLICGGRYHSK